MKKFHVIGRFQHDNLLVSTGPLPGGFFTEEETAWKQVIILQQTYLQVEFIVVPEN